MLGISEAGNRDGDVELSADSFVRYQRQLAAVLDRWADTYRWRRLEVAGMEPARVASAVAGQVVEWLASRTGGS